MQIEKLIMILVSKLDCQNDTSSYGVIKIFCWSLFLPLEEKGPKLIKINCFSLSIAFENTAAYAFKELMDKLWTYIIQFNLASST